MKIRITKRGCYGRVNKEVKELEIGFEIEVKDIPRAFDGRCIVIEQEKTKQEAEPLILIINEKETDLSKLKLEDLKNLVTTNDLGIEQEDKELKADFAKRVYDAAIAKLGG